MDVDFKVIANGGDITAKIRDRLLSLTVSDSAGESSDTVTISLDNRDDLIAFPETGATLDVFIGRTGALIFKGTYEIDELTEHLADGVLEVHGKSTKFKSEFKSAKSATYDDTTLGALIAKIAGAHGYGFAVPDDIASIKITHVDQVNESDMNLLTRIARDNDIVIKPAANKLVAVKKGEQKSASGKQLPTVTISDPYNSSGTVTIEEREDVASVSARYFDEAKQAEQKIIAGSGTPCAEIGRLFASKEEAEKAAQARLKKVQRGKKKMTLVRPLSPEIIAEGKIVLSGHRQSANGEWQVESVVHTIQSGSYSSTTLQCITPT